MSERDPNPGPERPPEWGGGPERSAGYPADPYADPVPAPVAEIEAEIKAEIAAEMEAERARARAESQPSDGAAKAGLGGPGTGDPTNGSGWPDPPPPVADPAAEVLAWLRGEFDEVNANLQSLANRLGRQEEAVMRITGSQEAEMNSSLAELEGCSAQLRNEAAILRDTRSELARSLPKLVAAAVESAVAGTVADAVADMRGTVAQLGAALAEALPAAVADAIAPSLIEAVPADASRRPSEAAGDGAGQDEPESEPDLVSQLHEAQDEAAEWFTIVVDEAVRRAVERWLPPAVPGTASAAQDTTVSGAGSSETAGPGRSTEAAGLQVEPASPAEARVGPDALFPAGNTVPSAADASPAGAPEAYAAGSDGPTVVGTATPVASPPAPRESTRPAATDDGSGQHVAGSEREAAASVPAVTDGNPAATPESGAICILPGVAVGPTLAMGVRTALGRARLRRRRRRPAGAPAAGLFRHDPFAGELSRRLERFALARRDMAWSPDPAPTGLTDGDGQAGSTNGVVVVAERHGRELVVDLTAGPLALTGPDADDACRALVATFLAAGQPSTSRVVAAGNLLPPGPAFPGLDRFSDLSAALDGLEAEVARRREGTPTGHGEEPRDAERPLVMLVTSAPPPELDGRLARLAEQGPTLGVAVVAIGHTTAGARVVDLDSGARVRQVTPPAGADLAGARMFRLGPSAMSEVLEVLAAARTDDAPTPTVELNGEPFPVLTATGPAPIQVRVLGPYRIDVGGEEIRSGLRAKARELLAFYLLHPEGTTLDVATEALWPEADPGRGSEWFWTALGNLRSRLRGVTGTKALKIIERDGDRYRIEPVFDVDLWRFQAALPSPGASTGDPKWAAALQGAADMYDGELLAGVDWAWADVPREDLRRRAVDVLVSLGATRLVAGDVQGALDVLSHAVEVDPVAEQLYRRIMRLHAKQARPDEVEASYERLKARLAELGLEPTVESQQLVKELMG